MAITTFFRLETHIVEHTGHQGETPLGITNTGGAELATAYVIGKPVLELDTEEVGGILDDAVIRFTRAHRGTQG